MCCSAQFLSAQQLKTRQSRTANPRTRSAGKSLEVFELLKNTLLNPLETTEGILVTVVIRDIGARARRRKN